MSRPLASPTQRAGRRLLASLLQRTRLAAGAQGVSQQQGGLACSDPGTSPSAAAPDICQRAVATTATEAVRRVAWLHRGNGMHACRASPQAGVVLGWQSNQQQFRGLATSGDDGGSSSSSGNSAGGSSTDGSSGGGGTGSPSSLHVRGAAWHAAHNNLAEAWREETVCAVPTTSAEQPALSLDKLSTTAYAYACSTDGRMHSGALCRRASTHHA
jgi:hypothetical protein